MVKPTFRAGYGTSARWEAPLTPNPTFETERRAGKDGKIPMVQKKLS